MHTTSLRHRTTKTVRKGSYYPLGASLTPEGVNFALYSKHATEVFLLLFDRAEGEPTDVMQLQHRTKFIWHVCVTGLQVGQLYGYKVRGEYRPERGLRFNEAKLLLDPYAKAVTGKFRNVDNLHLFLGRFLGDDIAPQCEHLCQTGPVAVAHQSRARGDMALLDAAMTDVHRACGLLPVTRWRQRQDQLDVGA